MLICFGVFGLPSEWTVTLIQKSWLKVHSKLVMMNSRVPSLQGMVHGQASEICSQSSLISSQFGGRFSKFCGFDFLKLEMQVFHKLFQTFKLMGI